MEQLEDTRVHIPYHVDDKSNGDKLETNAILGVIQVLPYPHGQIYHEEKVSVKGADIIKDVCRSLAQTQEEDQKVEPPEHLQNPRGRVIALEIEEGEVSEAGHPNVAGDHNANGVINLGGTVVVVQEENKLHPSLPFLCLVTAEEVVGGCHIGNWPDEAGARGRGKR